MEESIKVSVGLPYNTYSEILSEILPVLCNALPVSDVLSKRALSFLHDCVNTDYRIISRYALPYDHMSSPCYILQQTRKEYLGI